MQPLFTLILLLFLSTPAQANDYPNAVQNIINDARPLCEFSGGQFSFDPLHLTTADLNKDGHSDYLLSSEGFTCSHDKDLYKTDLGYNYYVLLSSGSRTLRLDRKSSRPAHNAHIDTRTSPPQLIFDENCVALSATRTQSRWSWSGTSLVQVASTPPCLR